MARSIRQLERACVVQRAAAVVRHAVVAQQEAQGVDARFLSHSAARVEAKGVAAHDVPGVDILEGIIGVVLANHFAFDQPARSVQAEAAIVEVDGMVVGRYALHRAFERQPMPGLIDCLGREVEGVCPEIFLVGQSAAVEGTYLEAQRHVAEFVGEAEADIAHVAHLLGDKGAVGEVLAVGRAVGVNTEGHAHLSEADIHTADGPVAHVGIKHFDFSFVGEVDFGAIADGRVVVVFQTDAGVAHFKATLTFLRLIFALGTNRSVNLGQPLTEAALGNAVCATGKGQ